MIKEVAIPEGTEVRKEDNNIVVKGPKGELIRTLKHSKIKINVKGNLVSLKSEDDRRRSKGILGTFAAHVQNMVNGVTHGYEARLKVVYSHFPVRIKAENNESVVENFVGEKKPRIAKILPDTEVKIEKDDVIVTGVDKEKVGITASRIERIAKVTGFDRRVFSDGIYITEKPKAIGGQDTVATETTNPEENKE